MPIFVAILALFEPFANAMQVFKPINYCDERDLSRKRDALGKKSLFLETWFNDETSVVQLLKNEVNPDEPLPQELRKGDLTTSFRFSLRRSPDIYASSYLFGVHTPLEITSVRISPESTTLARHLLDYGANPNGTGQEGFTPLMKASLVGNVPIAGLLLQYGVDTKKTFNLLTARDLADEFCHQAIVKLIDAADQTDVITHDQVSALSLGLHPRVGQDSPITLLGPDPVRHIASFVRLSNRAEQLPKEQHMQLLQQVRLPKQRGLHEPKYRNLTCITALPTVSVPVPQSPVPAASSVVTGAVVADTAPEKPAVQEKPIEEAAAAAASGSQSLVMGTAHMDAPSAVSSASASAAAAASLASLPQNDTDDSDEETDTKSAGDTLLEPAASAASFKYNNTKSRRL